MGWDVQVWYRIPSICWDPRSFCFISLLSSARGFCFMVQDGSSSLKHHNHIPAVGREGTEKHPLLVRILPESCTWPFCLYSIGLSLVTWLFLAVREAEKWNLYSQWLCVQGKMENWLRKKGGMYSGQLSIPSTPFINGWGNKRTKRGRNFSKVTHLGSERVGTSAQPAF